MAAVFLYHVVGDLTVGKPEMVEFSETETVESAIQSIAESTECGIPVWKKRSHVGMVENSEMRQQRFVGILNSFDIVAFLARTECSKDHDRALKTPVSEVVATNNSLLRLVDPGTRLIDALEMMKNGVRRLLVPKSVVWKGMSKRFSVLYNGRWLKNIETSSSNANINRPSSSTASIRDKFCCLSREDVIRFVIGFLGALAPVPLSTIFSVGAINLNYKSIEASLPAIDAIKHPPGDPSAVAVVETTSDGQYLIVGEISSSKLWKCDYLAEACALANLSAGQFVMGVDDNATSDFWLGSAVGDNNGTASNEEAAGLTKARTFSSRSIGFRSTSQTFGRSRSMYRGRSAPLTCKVTSSLAAVMAQMLSHRATHVWVTEDGSNDVLVGVVGYADILVGITKQPANSISSNRSLDVLASVEVQH